jgi:D-alanine-D-alanine ligase
LRPRTPEPRPPLGRIEDLEARLPAEWWRSLFGPLYLRTDGDLVENAAHTAHEVDLLVRAGGFGVGDRLLDVCCGQGRHSLELARRGFAGVVGVDASRYLTAVARKRARRLAVRPRFHVTDARRLRFPDGWFDGAFLMGNSFGYFERESDDTLLLAAVRRVLRRGGTLVLDVADGDYLRARFEPRSWEWIDDRVLACRQRALSADGRRLVCRELVLDLSRGVVSDQFYAETLYSEADFRRLLEGAGFGAVRRHATLRAGSDRRGDAGMMAQRLLLSAEAGAAARAPARLPAPRRVAVVLGDPSLPDPAKRGGRFGAGDLALVTRLKQALGELTGYRFCYLDQHATLIDDLQRCRPELVLNLCDEGFANDPAKEPHVAALLELLGLAYVGCGPQALVTCYDKGLGRSVAESLGIAVPRETRLEPGERRLASDAVFPVIVKPLYGDGSDPLFRRAVFREPAGLECFLDEVRRLDAARVVLVQEFLEGPEYTVAVLGNPGLDLRPLPVMEVDYAALPSGLPPILAYDYKWVPESPYAGVAPRPAVGPEDVLMRLQQQSLRLFERLGCCDWARFDFRAGADGEVRFLEANPNPGWGWDCRYAAAAAVAGLGYPELLRALLTTAERRYGATRGD